MLLMQIYVEDIIVGATNESLCEEFSYCKQKEFEMSMMGEFNFLSWLKNQANQECYFYKPREVCKKTCEKVQIVRCQDNWSTNEHFNKTW